MKVRDGIEKQKRISAVDLFCGAGGLAYGLVKEGIEVVAGVDVDENSRYPFEKNCGAKFILKDIRELSQDFLPSLYPKGNIRLLVGCAPCQPFSTYNQGKRNRRDEKWGLLYNFSDMIEAIRPEIVSMENVCRLTEYDVYRKFRNRLERSGYHIWDSHVACADYEVPQLRKRLVLLASLLGPIQLVEPIRKKDKYLTVRNTIGHLDPIAAGEVSKSDSLHRASSLSEKNLKRIRSSKQGKTWRDWDRDLIADCHKKHSGKTYASVYGRMEWDKPSPTITTQCFGFGNGRFGHPSQDRAISLREAALLQSFPEDYQFVEPENPIYFKSIGRLIGNAVPVKLSRAIGRTIIEHIRNLT